MTKGKKSFKNYTLSEKRAYWIGVGAGYEHRGDGKKVNKLRFKSKNIKDEKAKQSFLRGFLSGRKGRGTGAINQKFNVKKKTQSGGDFYAKRYNLKPIKQNSKKPEYTYHSFIDFDENGKVKFREFDI